MIQVLLWLSASVAEIEYEAQTSKAPLSNRSIKTTTDYPYLRIKVCLVITSPLSLPYGEAGDVV